MTHATLSTVRVLFTRKPYDLNWVLNNSDPDRTTSPVEIELRKELTIQEYDDFARTLLEDRDWLRGRGGLINQMVHRVVEVSAPGRTTLYVDPSGSAYARYVGIAVE